MKNSTGPRSTIRKTEMNEDYIRRAKTTFESEPLRRFGYVYMLLGDKLSWGTTWPTRYKEPHFWLEDSHGSRKSCDTLPDLETLVDDPSFTPCLMGGYFVLIEETYKGSSMYVKVLATAGGDRTLWNLEVEIRGSNESQIVGAEEQSKKILDRTAAMDIVNLKERTVGYFEKVQKRKFRAVIGRISENVVSNLLSSVIGGLVGVGIGWFAGRALG